jgi:hypothetical protein
MKIIFILFSISINLIYGNPENIKNDLNRNWRKLSDVSDYIFRQHKETKILKKPRWAEDATIYTLSLDGTTIAIKMHPDCFPLASHIYCKAFIDRINPLNVTTKIIDSYVISVSDTPQRVAVYPFVEGVRLITAINNGLITKEQAKQEIYKIAAELYREHIYLILEDLNDFLLTENGGLILTDWTTLVDITQASEHSINLSAPFRKKAISKFVDRLEVFDMNI